MLENNNWVTVLNFVIGVLNLQYNESQDVNQKDTEEKLDQIEEKLNILLERGDKNNE